MNNQHINLPEAIAAVPTKEVTAMLRRIMAELNKRQEFETLKEPFGSHVVLKQTIAMLRGNRRFAAFLCVIGADPAEMFNRTRKEGTRADLKGIKKVKMLVDYVTGRTGAFERVSLALFAATIIAAKKGVKWVSNAEQELILSSLDITSLPEEVQDAIKAYQHKYMRIHGDSRPQSCRFRTTFSNLGAFMFSREDQDDKNRLGIMVNMDSPIVRYLTDRWELESVK